MNERNKNNQIFRSNSKTSSTDCKYNISGQLNEKYWSPTNKSQNDSENYSNQLINRSKVMLNGVERTPTKVSKFYLHEQQIKKYQPKKIAKKEIHLQPNVSKQHINEKQPDKVDKLSKLLSSSLSQPPNTIINVSNFENYNTISPLNRSPYNKSHSSYSSNSYGKQLSVNKNTNAKSSKYDRYLNYSSTDDSLNHYLNDFRSSKDLLNKINNYDYSLSDKLFLSSRNSSSNSKQTTPVCLKKQTLSLPLQNDKENLMDKKLLSSKVYVKQSAKDKECDKIRNDTAELNLYNDKKFTFKNQPNTASLASVQTSNRSLTLDHHLNKQCAKKLNDHLSIHTNPRLGTKHLKTENNLESDSITTTKSFLVNSSSSKIFADKQNDSLSELNEKVIKQITNQVSDRLTDQITSQLSNKLSSELTDQIKHQLTNQVLNPHDNLYQNLTRLNTDLLKLNDDLYYLNDNLMKGDKANQSNINRLMKKGVQRNTNENENENRNKKIISFIDLNATNLKLNARFIHLLKHSELDDKSSNLLLNLVQEDHCGIILCLGT